MKISLVSSLKAEIPDTEATILEWISDSYGYSCIKKAHMFQPIKDKKSEILVRLSLVDYNKNSQQNLPQQTP